MVPRTNGVGRGDLSKVDLEAIVDSLGGGVYVCDLDRTIRYWSKSAERITGWRKEDILGKRCLDDILCHIDKDGHRLCGEEYCPLHRSMITGKASREPLLVYARRRDGQRVATLVNVAPLRDDVGRIIGGVEIFEDASAMVHDMERAKAIQRLAMEQETLHGIPGRITTHYIPRDIVGGDYFAVRKLGNDLYGVMVADVMGHGVAAALYTMHLSSLWNRYCFLLTHPTEFLRTINRELINVVRDAESFATACCGLLDFNQRTFRFAGAGGPPLLWMRADGSHQPIESPGLPLGIKHDAVYEEAVVQAGEGDGLLLFTDGAVDVYNAAGESLGIERLACLLADQEYPLKPIQMDRLEEGLLKFSSGIRLEDDLTLVEASFQ
ncbi:MAG TPA: SpoIIE family protein phosphatase [Thermoguttaceae bacterium]|nr:SpoIIE family protein phosphatase [Thermoguttaceae bacterium]